MTSFAERCGLHDTHREAACLRAAELIESSGVQRVRMGWCDVHGQLRGKTLMAHAAVKALRDGVGMVGTMMLKDTSDHTAWKVFEAGGTEGLTGFAGASNLMLLPDPASGEPALAVVQESGVGSRATRWYSGDGPPPSTLQPPPAVGDFYLDRLSGQVYELSA